MTTTEALVLANVSVAFMAVLATLWNGRKIKEVHHLTNSRMTELLEAVKKSSFSAGGDAEREKHVNSPGSDAGQTTRTVGE